MQDTTTRKYWVEIQTKGKKTPSLDEVAQILADGLKRGGTGKSSFPLESLTVGDPAALTIPTGQMARTIREERTS